jgi:hypothetical protein
MDRQDGKIAMARIRRPAPADDLNRPVEPGLAVGSRFKGSVRDSVNGAVAPGFAVGSRFMGSVRDQYGMV